MMNFLEAPLLGLVRPPGPNWTDQRYRSITSGLIHQQQRQSRSTHGTFCLYLGRTPVPATLTTILLLPGQFRKLDAVAVLTGPLLPAPLHLRRRRRRPDMGMHPGAGDVCHPQRVGELGTGIVMLFH